MCVVTVDDEVMVGVAAEDGGGDASPLNRQPHTNSSTQQVQIRARIPRA